MYANLLKILGRNMVFRSLMTSHNPNLTTYNADAADSIPAVLAEALVYTRPGILELLPALPDQLPRGSISGVRGRNRLLIQNLSWDTGAHTASVTLTSAIAQDITLICHRGIASVTSTPTVTVTSSALGDHARVVALPAATTIRLTVGLTATTPAATYRLVNRNSGKVLDSPSGSAQGAALDQSSDANSDNQWWTLVPASTSDYYRLVNVHNGVRRLERRRSRRHPVADQHRDQPAMAAGRPVTRPTVETP
jgi:alpha-L-fucosidase 2